MENEDLLQELKKIRELLEPKPAPPAPKGILQEFKVFLEQYKVMGLAVAFIFGIYLGALVQALVNDLVMPLIDVAMPGVAWQNIAVGPFLIGNFTGTLITFLIIAAVIFLIVKLTSKFGFK
ncbi:MAG: MscL family protein [Candidatus Marsarchaeota archaeon]|nr:MscL family protein [Candidatus Marsarchaeota archaeon]